MATTDEAAGDGAPTDTRHAVAQDLMTDLFDLSEPQPKYRALLEAAPVHRLADNMLLVGGRAEAGATLRDAGTFSAAGIVNLGNVRPLIPLSIDPPAHTRYRKILDVLFAPKRMNAMEEDITDRVNRFIDAFRVTSTS